MAANPTLWGSGVSEETAGVESAPEGPGAGIDPAAFAMALGAADREEANAFLRDQRKLIQLQAKELAHDLELRHWSLLVRHVSGVLKLTLEISLALMALALVGFGAASVWNATQADGLVIESFSMPADLAARGLTGEVAAGQLIDKLNTIQNTSGTASAPGRGLTGGWGNDIQVEIPETGISVAQVWRFLRKWLGNETTVSGEVYRTADGLAVTVHVAGGSATATGPEAGFDALVQKAAEHVMEAMQPTRYASYLENLAVPRHAEAFAITERTVNDPAQSAFQRYTGWNNLGVIYSYDKGDQRKGVAMMRQSLAVYPDYAQGISNLSRMELTLGHAEAAFVLAPEALKALDRHAADYLPRAVAVGRARSRYTAASLTGDFGEAVRQGQLLPDQRVGAVALSLAAQHDGKGALGGWRNMPPSARPTDVGPRAIARLQIAFALEDWQSVVASQASVEKTFAESDPGFDFNANIGTGVWPFVAVAKAKLGDSAGAEALIGKTLGDCYDCVRMRGKIAAIEQNWGKANYWFARAVQQAPSIPMAFADWGEMLLQKGDPDSAIDKFKLANQKGPHFADPLEGWGEALMAKNQSHLALAKFVEAEKYAPNWARLHLKWGEALFYAGRKDEAKAQFARAAQLDLTPAEKAELASQTTHA
jgi:tetratricopeptide (TPR) repeat protein